ncbi:DUF2834 domain-containing protein [Pseudomonas violetae]|jgi:hypothetical protein|uniref:DUF2834 domain-containing protein n=1 Tax=Pseudomonas violetae TaxID=2915813 RepID=A0ABT0F1Z7_9PSED|nr:DUF2834 domain-containing protein [Pseudomonas violetae]MCK1791980.1 DUF2834 domain-containing protein [Pseudomonas violetae]
MVLRLIALASLVLFSMYTGWTMLNAEQSLLAFGLELITQPDTAQLVIDLYLMAALACVWMAKDNRARGGALINLLPYLILTAVFVSVGPLLYVVVKGCNRERQT